MNTFTARKIGEVLAFNRIGIDTINQSKDVFADSLSNIQLADMLKKFRIHGEELLRIATDAGAVDETLAQASKDEEKLKAMRKDYMGEQHENDTEVFEWLGFFHGALIAHYALLRGIGNRLEHEAITMLSEEGVNWNYDMLELAESELEERGQDKAE